MNSSALPQSKWKAWHDRMPSVPATLHVSGKHTFPTAGYSAELKPASPQGINPKIYILDMMIHKPADPVIQIPEEVNIEYNEKTDVIYEQVCIRISSTEQVCVSVEEVRSAMSDMTDKNMEVRFNYAWEWWKFHAEQRTKMFQFFILVTGLLLPAYATALGGYIEYAIGVAALGAIIAVGFFLLDIRDRYQLKKADHNLEQIEQKILFTDTSHYVHMAGIDRPKPKPGEQQKPIEWGEREFVKHVFVLRGIEVLALVGWVALLIWTIQNPGRFAIPPAG